ncbi:MAG: hypothetical protein QOE70_4534 [Chthoniobacter sp.]|jgi:hypothetical protein|nr:hypothetical protein [Chthoniobacter sp.]
MIDALHPRTVNPPATPEELSQLEADLAVTLPSELRILLAEANGAWIPDVAIPDELCPEVPGGGINGYSLFSSRKIEERRAVYEGRVSTDLLVFGDDDFGNALCIGLDGPRRGKIYFWDHEEDVAGCLAIGN